MSFNASASVVYSFSDYDICPVDAEVEHLALYSNATEHEVLQLEATHSTSQCCTSPTCALYPPSSVSQLLPLVPSHTLALMENERAVKTLDLAQSLYRPPII